MKHKLNIKDEEIDSIREAISQAISKGVTEPALVRLDYKLEKLRQSPPRIKKVQEKSSTNEEKSKQNNVNIKESPKGHLIRIVSSKKNNGG